MSGLEHGNSKLLFRTWIWLYDMVVEVTTMKIKNIILKLRTERGMSQDELADKIMVTRQAVSRWENGDTVPNTDTLKLLSKEFDVSINTLLGEPRKLICQCCGMPIDDDSILGRDKDGTLNEEYCKWCYADGTYTYNDMDELIDVCVKNMVNENFTEEQARSYLKEMLPKLDYWKRYDELSDNGQFEEFKKQLMNEINDLHIDGLPRVDKLNALVGKYVNLEYQLPNGQKVKFLDDQKTYLGNQMESEFGGDRQWYDGFTFGSQRDIYNPWSITNYLKEKKLLAYWASTSSNDLINRLIQTSKPDVKEFMEELLNEREIVLNFDEQIVFDQLETKENAIWSLMVASGYLKIDKIEYRGILHVPWYHLKITNLETLGMFSEMFVGWFQNTRSNYNAFIKAMLCGNIKEMNAYMNEVALATFSSFDTGSHPSGRTQPERFYHGFVLGLLVELRDQYEVRSNRESGYGRYDVMLIPRQKNQLAFVLEFKVYDAQEELKLEDTVQSALVQIEEKDYDTELIERGISKSKIRHYGFAFEGKRVLIGE